MFTAKLILKNLKYVRFLCTERLHMPNTKTPRVGTLPFKEQKHLMLHQIFQKNLNINDEKWTEIRKELLNSEFEINENNVDVTVINACIKYDSDEVALNYVEFLKQKKYEMNIATVGKYFKLLYKIGKPLSKEKTDFVFALYDEVKAKHPILNGLIAESCIFVLSMTKRWKECFELLEMFKFCKYPMNQSYNAIAAAAFSNEDSKTAWECIQSMLPKICLNEKLYQSYIDFCKRNANNRKEIQALIDKMFEFWSDYDIYPEAQIINMFANYLESTGEWKVEEASINRKNGKCSMCQHQLSDMHITKKDFDDLSETFLKKVLVGNNVYYNTTPKELQDFKNFVAATKPYDIVIDALNVIFTLNRPTVRSNRGAELAEIVAACVKQKKKVFILGKEYMKTWSNMNYVENNACLFYINNTSFDDPFLLYAAFSSGMNTFFSSRDFMRQHKFTLSDPYLRKIFRHWQLTRQILPSFTRTSHKKKLFFIYPPKFLPIPQRTSNGEWHIPYTEERKKELQPFDFITLWKCFKINTSDKHDISIKFT